MSLEIRSPVQETQDKIDMIHFEPQMMTNDGAISRAKQPRMKIWNDEVMMSLTWDILS
jgi:hypothetical protein